MSVFHNNALIGAGAGTGEAPAAAEYVIPKSLRFNSDDTSYLNRTPSAAGNRRTWTLSWWMKLADPKDTDPQLFSIYTDANNRSGIFLDTSADYQLGFYSRVGGTTQLVVITDAVLRDYSAWYHCVISVDTTAATSSDRAKIYINGVEQSLSSSTYPSQNYETYWNLAAQHDIGRYGGATQLFDGLMADIQFVDGQALAPTDFGETRSSDGVWVPKEANITSPNDGTVWSSGTQTNPDTSRPLSNLFDGSVTTLIAAASGNNSSSKVTLPASVTAQTSVRYYSFGSGYNNGPTTLSNSGTTVSTIAAESNQASGWKSFTGTFPMTFNEFTINRSSDGTGSGAAAIEVDGVVLMDRAGAYGINGFHLNFSDSSTNEALGFDSAPTTPDPDPKKGMDVITYTGNGGTQNIGGLNFEPGLIWIKVRDQPGDHKLIDSVRGASKRLESNTTDAEETATTGITSFNPDGFSLGSSGTVNGNNYSLVAWAWRAGGPAVSNTDGTITAQVSASTDFGFSIVSFVGTGANATVGHGLNTAPKFVWAKTRTKTDGWPVYHSGGGSNYQFFISQTDAGASGTSYFNGAPTSALVNLGNNSGSNQSGEPCLLYCWSEVSGYSKISTYSGTGSTHTVDCGFRPAFLIMKSSTGSYNWQIKDNQRGDKVMFADTNAADTSDGVFDFTDNGFTVTGSGNATNASGVTYIFVAFADRPGNNWDVNNIVTNEGLTTSKTQFDVVTYTGNGGTQSIDSLAFQPDLVWLKSRSASQGNILFDSVRGVSNAVFSNNTLAETGQYQKLSSFDSNGFTLTSGTDGSSPNEGNTSSNTYVAWCWKAGGTAVSNTDGSITSSVSANAQYGFSIVSYTGTGANATVGHGLGKSPNLIIIKNRDTALNDAWRVWASALAANERLVLNETKAVGSGSTLWQNTLPTSSVFYLDNESRYNTSGDDHIAYCFANVPGYQRIGSYTGNGSSTGPVIVTGFKPRFLLVKRTDSTGSWVMLDSERNPANPLTKSFYADTSDAEYAPGQNWADFDESSFQITATYGEVNASSGTYIYLAIGDDEIGSDEDCLVDVPNAVTADADATDTTGGYQRGNYMTINPLSIPSQSVTLSNGNLHMSGGGTNVARVGTIAIPSSGKWYWEITCNSGGSGLWLLGINGDTNSQAKRLVYVSDARKYTDTGGGFSSYGSSFTIGDVIGVAVDMDADTLEFYKNGVSQGTAFTSISSGYTDGIFPYFQVEASSRSLSLNAGQMRFKYPIPSGYATLNTTALPTATVADGSAQFDAKLYTGNGSTQQITGFEFSPDFVWLKSRSNAYGPLIIDTVRGAGKELYPNTTDQEEAPAAGNISSFNSDGFTLAGRTGINGSGATFVGWSWNASANSNKTYTVKVVSDSGNKYRFDDFGTSAVTLDLAEGSTYVFDQSDSSNSGHPLRFSTTSDGTHGGGSEYTTGVTATGTPGSAGAKTTIVVGSGVATLYYYCTNHSGMGGQANTNSTAGASNFDGSIQATVKANPEAGFSIATFTGTGASATIGHGLNAEPHLLLTKCRESGFNWAVYHKNLGNTGRLMLNNTLTFATSSTFWNDTTPTSSVFSVGSFFASGNTFVSYCIAPVAGYSSVGQYTGNGSSSGPFVYTGFRVAFILIRRSNAGGAWVIVDNKRDGYNETYKWLEANTDTAEQSVTPVANVDFLSNGFKLRGNGATTNASGGEYIYWAVAENPFQANGGLAR